MDEQSHEQQSPPALSEALTTANALLISSLAAGNIPITDDAQLKQQIEAYRSSIDSISKQLEQLGSNLGAQDVNHQQQQQQTAEDQPADYVPGIGKEGVDYTVRIWLTSTCTRLLSPVIMLTNRLGSS